MDISSLLQDLRSDRLRRRRDAPTKGFVPLGPRAWKKRAKKQKELIDKEYDRQLRRKLAQQRYYEKNKAKLNRIRALKARQPDQVFKKARLRAKRRGQEWQLTFDEWWSLWCNAPEVYDKAKGMKVPAWNLKGSDCSRNTQMKRRDTDGPWSTDNCYIGGGAYSGYDNESGSSS